MDITCDAINIVARFYIREIKNLKPDETSRRDFLIGQVNTLFGYETMTMSNLKSILNQLDDDK